MQHQNGFWLRLESSCESSELTPQITSEGNSKIPTNFRITVPPLVWLQIWNFCTSRKSLEINTLSTLKNAGKKWIKFYVKIFTGKSKLRFVSLTIKSSGAGLSFGCFFMLCHKTKCLHQNNCSFIWNVKTLNCFIFNVEMLSYFIWNVKILNCVLSFISQSEEFQCISYLYQVLMGDKVPN